MVITKMTEQFYSFCALLSLEFQLQFQRTDEEDISSENDDTEYNAAQSGKFITEQGFD